MKEKIINMLEGQNTVYVRDLLPILKANKFTYNNLDKSSINDFKSLYSYCKKIEDKKVNPFYFDKIKNILDDEKLVLDALYKVNIMKVLSSMTDFDKDLAKNQ